MSMSMSMFGIGMGMLEETITEERAIGRVTLLVRSKSGVGGGGIVGWGIEGERAGKFMTEVMSGVAGDSSSLLLVLLLSLSLL